MNSFQRILDADITSKKIFEMFSQLTNAAVNLAKEYPDQMKLPTVSLNWTEKDKIPEGTLIPVLTFEMIPFDAENMRDHKESKPENIAGGASDEQS